jgi:beta-1,4-mannosyl-glycoprotein beta-1,4-N-acetylglucosaminyltransferase
MKIIDSFVFYNELDMLNLRLHELNEHVDYFILVEANKTYSNNPKNFIFEQNKFKYQKFLHKIIHIKVNDMPNGDNNWEREFHQRNCIGRGLELVLNLNDKDIILLSDVDEIIKSETIMKLKENKITKMYNLNMDLYYYNLENKAKDANCWPLVRAGPFSLIKEYKNISDIRKKKFDNYNNCGWHLSYFGGVEKIKNKIKNFSHQEYNKKNILDTDSINNSILNNKDLLKRGTVYGGFTNISINKNNDLPLYYSFVLFPLLKPLTHLGYKHNTDKSYYHLFTEFYDDYFETFKTPKINILEIGIYQGSSLKLLEEYFPNATIHAIDINKEYVNKKYGERIKTYHCSQDNFQEIDRIFKDIKFDIIMDDGSHQTIHQHKSLGHMFSYLNKNGIYVCEDLHTSYNKGYCNTNVSTLDMLEKFNKEHMIKSDYILKDQLKYLNDNIQQIEIYKRDKNALKCYKCGKINFDDNDTCECKAILGYKTNPSITSVICHK